jgi:hypothetical protein
VVVRRGRRGRPNEVVGEGWIVRNKEPHAELDGPWESGPGV